MSTRPIVLITGGSGFLGSWIVHHLLENGYKVRALARASKIAGLIDTHAQARNQLEVIEIQDLANDDLGKLDVFDGVDALIHTAAPVPSGSPTLEAMYAGHMKGMDNVVAAAAKAEIKRIVYTSALHALFGGNSGAIFEPGHFNENSTGPEELESFNPKEVTDDLQMYFISHSLAEKRFWNIAKEYPGTDFTSILPSMCYGGFVPGYPDDRKGTGSTRFMYSLLIGAEGEQMKVFPKFPFSQQVNAYDVAKAHVKALETPPLPASDGRRKRFIISQGCYTYMEAIRLLKKERPELAWRLPDENDPAGTKQSKKVFDTSLAAEILGIKQADYVGPEKTLLDTIDQLVGWEKATGQSPSQA